MDPQLLLALSKIANSSSVQTLNGNSRDAVLMSQAQAAAAVNPRISRALRELEAAEAFLARTHMANSVAVASAARIHPPGTSPWLFNSMLPGPTSTVIHPPLQSAFGIARGLPMPPLITPETSPELATSRKSICPGPPTTGVTRAASDAMSVGDSTSTSVGPEPLVFVDDVKDNDILCGRGGKSNHHPGNKKYRLVVSRMKMNYRRMGSKMLKTDLSRAIVEHVYGYGGRFLKYDKDTSRYAVLSSAEARKKTSQALREMKEVKWFS
jgi:hypothetical protein